MTTKPWGHEPANPFLQDVGEPYPAYDRDINVSAQPFFGFTKLEDACIRLKVTDQRLHPDLNALITESRRLDYAGQALISLIGLIGIPEDGPDDIWDAETTKQAVNIGKAMLSELEKK